MYMIIFEEVKKYYENDFGDKTLVVGTEAESLQIKEILFSLGAEIVSDRDIVTLDYLLTQKLIQEERVRLIDDFLFPYTSANLEKRLVSDYVKFFKNFPDPFVENEIFEVLGEYFSENEEEAHNFEKLKKVFELSQQSLERKVIPRSFAKLGLYRILDSDRYIFLDLVLEDMPIGFQEQFTGGVLKTRNEKLEWNQQIDLYKVLKKTDTAIDFLNFSSQIEEVRFVLNKISKKLDLDKSIFIYPKNKGYENLFFIYQREFFQEQKFFYARREKSYLKKCIDQLKMRTGFIKTNYDQDFENKNIVKIIDEQDESLSLENVLNEFKGIFTEYDLNLLSPIGHQINPKKEIPILDWVDILLEIESREEKKFKKLSTELPIKDYSYFSTETKDDVYVLGWGDYLFRKNGERVFSNAILSGLERDLGLNLVSLNKSMATDLMRNLFIGNSNVKKHFLYSEKTAVGGSVKPGVFKILWDQENNRSKVERNSHEVSFSTHREKANLQDKKISASSLQKYDECAYKFYLNRVIGLNIEEDEDYFLSAKEEGLLIHRALEELKKDNLNKQDLEKILEERIYTDNEELNHFRKASLVVFIEKLWGIIQSEKEYLKGKGIVKVESEKFFSFYADLETKSFVEDEVGYKVSGVVDRIDHSRDNEIFLYDYKRADTGSISLARYTGSKLSPQLFLYCIAADKGFLGNFKDFLGFQYINVKAYKRSKGFVDKENGKSFAREVPQGSAVTLEKYEEKMDIFLNKFWETLEKISIGFFDEKPNPLYSGACGACEWVGVCKKSETFQ